MRDPGAGMGSDLAGSAPCDGHSMEPHRYLTDLQSMGMRAKNLFTQSGIEVLVGATAQEPEELVTAYLNGTLQTGENLCDH